MDNTTKIINARIDAKLRQMQGEADRRNPHWNQVQGKPSEFPPENHGNEAHSATFITAGDIPAIPDTFTDLTDTPANYTGQAGRAVLCNSGETGLVFGTVAASGGAGGYSEPLICASSGEFLYASNNDILSGRAVLD